MCWDPPLTMFDRPRSLWHANVKCILLETLKIVKTRSNLIWIELIISVDNIWHYQRRNNWPFNKMDYLTHVLPSRWFRWNDSRSDVHEKLKLKNRVAWILQSNSEQLFDIASMLQFNQIDGNCFNVNNEKYKCYRQTKNINKHRFVIRFWMNWPLGSDLRM